MLFLLLICLLYSIANSQSVQRDPVLDQLRAIKLPHVFTPSEQQMIMNQLDILDLGLTLFLTEERERNMEQQQQVYSMVWPLLKCLFRKDFEMPRQPGNQPGQQSGQQPGQQFGQQPGSPFGQQSNSPFGQQSNPQNGQQSQMGSTPQFGSGAPPAPQSGQGQQDNQGFSPF